MNTPGSSPETRSAAEYVQMLEDNYDCSILGSRDAPKEEPDFQAERGRWR